MMKERNGKLRREGLDETSKDLSREVLLQILSIADIDNDGTVTFKEFHRAMILAFLSRIDAGAPMPVPRKSFVSSALILTVVD